MPRLRLLAALTVAAATAATPALATDHGVSVAGYAFTPGTLTVVRGDTVTWHFDGPDTNHSITTADGQAESFDSDPGRMPTSLDHLQGSTYTHRFDVLGTIAYLCKVHTNMRATVTVVAPAGPPPPTADTTGPVVSGVRIAGSATRPTLRLTLSEPARVVVLLRRGATHLKLVRAVQAGRSVVRLPRGLRPGRYRLTLTASDASGNAAGTRHLSLTVPRS